MLPASNVGALFSTVARTILHFNLMSTEITKTIEFNLYYNFLVSSDY